MGIFQTYGAQSIPVDKIETTPTVTDLIETRDAADTNDAKAISLANVFANMPSGTVKTGIMDPTLIKYAEVAIPAADIVSTSAGKLGHAQGQELVAAPGAAYVLELISAVLIYDYAGAGYGSGGNLTVTDSASGRVTPDDIQKAASHFSRYASRGIALAVPEVPLAARLESLAITTQPRSQ